MSTVSNIGAKLFDAWNNNKKRKPATLAEKFAKEHGLSTSFPAVSRRGFYSEADRGLVDKIWKAHGLTDRDNVQIFVVPKNSRVQTGTFIHRPTESHKTRRLMLEITRMLRQLGELERTSSTNTKDGGKLHEPSEQEVARERHILQRDIESRRRTLARERKRLANGPRSGFIVVRGNG